MSAPPRPSSAADDEIQALRDRITELEATEAARDRAERVQDALYRIAETAGAAEDMQDFYAKIHAIVRELMYADNLYIALYDAERDALNFPYFVDEVDLDVPDPNAWEPFGIGDASGLTAHLLRTGAPMLLTEADQRANVETGLYSDIGEYSVDWLGIPLQSEGKTLGALVVQSYREDLRHTQADKELLTFVGRHIASALERTRLIDETRQRNAELALINDVQRGLAENLDMQSMYDLVGDRIQAIFDAQVVDIGILGRDSSSLIHFPYTIERGVRFPDEPIEVIGFRRHALETQEPLVINENVIARQAEFGNPSVLQGEPAKSLVYVPLVVGGQATGVISLQNLDREHAFSDADVRLLTTLAGSLSVALENARLFEETKQRNAELALINDVQRGLAENLEMQAMYDLVGDRIQEIFDAQVVDIGILDRSEGLLHFPYTIERGVRFPDKPMEVRGFGGHVMRTREPLLINERLDERSPEFGADVIQGEDAKSVLFVPLLVGGEATGRISLQNLDREHAFSEADVRLLTTLAGSLSVALENARLFGETRQRNAELALLNDVQRGLAENLEMQAMYDLVGDRLQQVFDAEIVDIGVVDEETQLIRFPYTIERGERFPDKPMEIIGFRRHVLETRESLLINERLEERAAEFGNPAVHQGGLAKSVLFVPLIVGGKPTGVILLGNLDREHAFGEGDVRLLTTLAGSLSVALENARLFEETKQRAAELAIVNDVGQALAAQLDLDALIERLGDQLCELFSADIVYIALHDRVTDMIDFAYYNEHGSPRGRNQPLRFGEGLTSRILQTREPLLLNRESAFQSVGIAMVGTPAKSYLGVPIFAGKDAIGVISVQSTEETGRFGESDSRLLATIAANVGVAIQNARLYAETGRRASEMAAIAELGREIGGLLDLDAVLRRIAERAKELLEASESAVFLQEQGGERFLPIVALGTDADLIMTDTIQPGEGILGDIANCGVAEVVNDVGGDARSVPISGATRDVVEERLMGTPLLAGGRVIGLMGIWRPGSANQFTNEDLSFLVGLSQQAAIAIENARLFQESKEAEERYRRLVEELPLAVYTDRPDESGTSEYMSPRVEAIFGYPRERWLEEDFFASVLHPDDRERVLEDARRQLASNEDRFSAEYRIIAADGSTHWVRDDQWIVRDDRGVPIHLQGFLIDITESTAAAAEIRRQKQYFESLVDISPVAVVTMDRNEVVSGWNPAAARLFGFTPEEAIGRRIESLVVPEELAAEGQAIVRESIEVGRAHRITRRRRKDGRVVEVEVDVVPLMVDGEHQGHYAIYHDITELQEARRAADAANEAKSAFLATMSHEIRTPMNAIIGMSGLLADTELDVEQREYAATIAGSGEALLAIINDILDFSKIEAGRMELEEAPFDLRACMEAVVDLIGPVATKKGLEVAYEIEPGVPETAVGDASRLRQILLNLLNNAVKFTERGQIDLRAESSPSSDPAAIGYHLSVRDTGIGVPADRIDRLFQSFSQADVSISRRYGGTGLGLAISKRLAELMGGTMWVESAGIPGEGSIFHLTIEAGATDLTPTALRRHGSFAGRRALVVDDNATNRRLMTELLGAWGIQTVTAASAGEALAAVEDGPFDLAVLDMLMPETDGLDLAIGLHERLRDLPVVLASSVGRREVEADPRWARAGIGAAITKPIKASPLSMAVSDLLGAATGERTGEEAASGALDAELASRHPLRILLAEDNVVNQKLAIRVLEKLGYRADVVANGLETLEALERQPYDLLLTDVQMPEMDGVEATRRIIERWPGDERPWIVAMTAEAMQGDRERFLEAGMNDYVQKPIHIDELVAAIRRAPRRTAAAGDTHQVPSANGPVDEGVIRRLVESMGGDRAFVAELIDQFNAETPALVASARAGIETGDHDEVRRAAHTLKSNAATFGAHELAARSRALEDAAKARALENGLERVKGIAEELERVRAALLAIATRPD